MANRRKVNFKQQYSASQYSNQTAGRKNNSELTTASGRYNGSRKAQTRAEGGLGRNGQFVNRRGAYYDVRSAFNDISPRAAQAMLDAGQISQDEYNRMYGGTREVVSGGGGSGSGSGIAGGGSSSGGGRRGLGLSAG